MLFKWHINQLGYKMRWIYNNGEVDYKVNIWCLNICVDEYDGKRKKCSKIYDMNNVNDVNMDFICNYIH